MEAEERLAAEQAARAEEDARLRELYPLPEDEEDYVEGQENYVEGDETSSEMVEGESSDATAPEDESEVAR